MKSLVEHFNEGLINAFKIKRIVTDVQAKVAQMCVDEIEGAKEGYYTQAHFVLRKIENDAIDLYKKSITPYKDEALTPYQWWKQFSTAYERYLDATIFDKQK